MINEYISLLIHLLVKFYWFYHSTNESNVEMWLPLSAVDSIRLGKAFENLIYKFLSDTSVRLWVTRAYWAIFDLAEYIPYDTRKNYRIPYKSVWKNNCAKIFLAFLFEEDCL